MDFSNNVFINCPFDEDYKSLLRPLLFTIIYFKLHPRIALEKSESSQQRLHKIYNLIQESKFGIHDLSRLKATKKGEYYRLNMPLELGLDMGCKQYGNKDQQNKSYLVIATDSYQYRAAASDLSGADIDAHKDEPENIVRIVRGWLVNQTGIKMHGASKIWGDFLGFMADNFEVLKKRGFSENDIKEYPVPELMVDMKQWIANNVN